MSTYPSGTTFVSRLTRRRTLMAETLTRAGMDAAAIARAGELAEPFVTAALDFSRAMSDEDVNAQRYAPDYRAERRRNLLAKTYGLLNAAYGPLNKHGEAAKGWRANVLAGLVPDETTEKHLVVGGWLKPRPAPRELTQVDELRRREVRDLVRDRLKTGNLKPYELKAQYLSAIASGDEEFIGALEAAPQSFPLLSAEQLHAGAEAKLDKSPHGPTVRTMGLVQEAVDLFADGVWREVGEEAGLESAAARRDVAKAAGLDDQAALRATGEGLGR